MYYPHLKTTPQDRIVTDRFLGYDHRLRSPDGAFYETENLSLRHFPLLSTRPLRGKLATLSHPGGLLVKDALCYVDDGTLYVNGLATPVTGLRPGEKQLVSMGAWLLIFPDKVYYNTAEPSNFGPMEASYEANGPVRYSLCDLNGRELPDPVLSETEPPSPENGAWWLDTSGGGRVLRQWSAASAVWVEQAAVYVKLTLPTTGLLTQGFRPYDGVTVEGAFFDALNGEKILYALGGGENEPDYLVLSGLIDRAFTDENAAIRLRRTVPDMDYVCACRNRLWGCRYGSDGRKVYNEVYASALGDFRNFRQFLGLSTDSWTASVGSDGPFTGAIDYLGRPCFFKEDRIHQVTISAAGAHRLDETPCRGVQRGSAKSLCVVGESLYYKSPGEVCVWQGGFPQSVSAALGEAHYRKAVGGAIDGRYYLSMEDGAGAAHLFVYDTEQGLWTKEDGLRVLAFAADEEELYAIDADTGALLSLKGSKGQREESLSWLAETGILHYRSADRKYVSRYNLSLRMAAPARLRLWLRYDSEGDWEAAGELTLSGPGTVTVPVRPRRCDHLQLRLEGEGELKLYAITRVLETGSDM